MTDGPLSGVRVLVTRPAGQADELVAAIEAAGGEVIRFPVIKITGRGAETVAADLGNLPAPDIAIFVSSNAVANVLPALKDSGASMVAIGPATAAAIEAAGVTVDIAPLQGFDSEHLLEHPALQDVQGKTIVIARGEYGRTLLGDTLKSRGAEVRYLAVYRREANRLPDNVVADLDEAWQQGRISCVIVMSIETLKNLLLLLPPAALERLRETPLVAPANRVIQEALELVPGIPAILALGPSATDMLNALIDSRHSGKIQ